MVNFMGPLKNQVAQKILKTQRLIYNILQTGYLSDIPNHWKRLNPHIEQAEPQKIKLSRINKVVKFSRYKT